MTINVIDRISPLGAFPICSDVDLLGGFRSVADNTERDAIVAADRKAGMWVWVQGATTLYRLDPPLTNSDWVAIPLGGGGGLAFRGTFVDGDLTAGVLTITHSFGFQANQVSVYNNSDLLVFPDDVEAISTTQALVTLSAFQTAYGGAIPGTWRFVVTG